jgi:HSP20 family molecular chaperone IbpA
VNLGEAQSLDAVYAEVRVAHYKRSFVLSRDLDTSKIDAAMKDGVLTVKVPKLEQAKPRRIAVRAE